MGKHLVLQRDCQFGLICRDIRTPLGSRSMPTMIGSMVSITRVYRIKSRAKNHQLRLFRDFRVLEKANRASWKNRDAWREAFEETLTDEERIERVNEMRTQENLENILFTVMAFDALTEHEVFRKNNEEAIKAFEEFLKDIYDPEAEVSEDRGSWPPSACRMGGRVTSLQATLCRIWNMIVPSKNAPEAQSLRSAVINAGSGN